MTRGTRDVRRNEHRLPFVHTAVGMAVVCAVTLGRAASIARMS